MQNGKTQQENTGLFGYGNNMARLLLVFTAALILGTVRGLDECGLVTVTASSPASHYGTLTPFYGNNTIWERYITTGATCSTKGGTVANLESVLWSTHTAKYRCKCMGSLAYARTRYCTLYVWRCQARGFDSIERFSPRHPRA